MFVFLRMKQAKTDKTETLEYMNSDQIINQSATRLSMFRVLMDQNDRFIKPQAK